MRLVYRAKRSAIRAKRIFGCSFFAPWIAAAKGVTDTRSLFHTFASIVGLHTRGKYKPIRSIAIRYHRKRINSDLFKPTVYTNEYVRSLRHRTAVFSTVCHTDKGWTREHAIEPITEHRNKNKQKPYAVKRNRSCMRTENIVVSARKVQRRQRNCPKDHGLDQRNDIFLSIDLDDRFCDLVGI